MTVAMRKPILVVGIGLSLILWGWESLNQNFADMGQWMIWVALALGSGVWWLRPKKEQLKPFKPVSPINQVKVEQAIAKTEKALTILAKENPNFDLTSLQNQLHNLTQPQTKQSVTIAIAGGKSTGKTTLINQFKKDNLGENVQIIETEPLFNESNTFNLDKLQIADLVIFLVNGDLTETEWQTLQYFQTHYQHPLLIFNKQDQHLPEDRALIIHQLRQRVENLLSEAEVIPVSLNPQPLTVRRYDADGSMEETLEPQPPELNGLIDTLTTILEEDKHNLLLGRVWRQANQLEQQIKAQINQIRRDQALPLIEKYQWISGTMAVANPVATLDLLATAAITAQMVLDLGTIYYQSFSLSQAKAVSTEMGKLMVKLGLVELSTQTISSLLKGNTMTYLAGGVIQGISAAYLTRIAGLSLVEYFQDQELSDQKGFQLNLEQLQGKMQEVFQTNQRIDFLKGFVSQALAKVA
ncbi:MAG: DUF697 domain-containing protein [Microcystaceae cyanobacterium]